jgi:hypothetical protein
MPRKGNPQHNARKRGARERAKAEHENGFMQMKRREVEHFRRVATANEQVTRALTAMILKS